MLTPYFMSKTIWTDTLNSCSPALMGVGAADGAAAATPALLNWTGCGTKEPLSFM